MKRNKCIRFPLLLKKGEAYTLIETLIIVGLIAVLAGMAITRLRSNYFSSFSLETTAHQIVADLRLTRILAIANAEDCKLIVYPADHQYKIFNSENNQIGATREIPSQIVASEDTEFTFQFLGNAISEGLLHLTTNGENYRITVSQPTGKVEYEKF